MVRVHFRNKIINNVSKTNNYFQSLIYSKALMRDHEKELLHKVNVAECDRLVERWPSEDCVNAVMKFFQDKMK